ncbi:MAG TPA: BTAD domain-containing putative transcriptional regulator, partial [Anaerolineae bacterium]|nr:BTAD domain-containing putative transcriptional regulator [Anaerolineae bacterium]
DDQFILSDLYTVQFDPRADLWLDVDEFRSLASLDNIASLQSAVELYRGDFLDGFYDDWVVNERYRLEALYLEALARLTAGHEGDGNHEKALAAALQLLDHDPLREDAHRAAMRAYCRLGRRSAALGQYDHCREVTLEELGVEPMAETTELYRAILENRFEVGRLPRAIPVEGPVPSQVEGPVPSQVEGPVPSQVEGPVPSLVEGPAAEPPVQAGRSPLDVVASIPLVGREQEMASLHRCWREAQATQGKLVLVSGEAGVGKSRLIEEFANRLRWQGVRVLWGRCYEFERVLPYQPVAEALRAVLATLRSDGLAGFPQWAITEVACLVPEMGALKASQAARKTPPGRYTQFDAWVVVDIDSRV